MAVEGKIGHIFPSAAGCSILSFTQGVCWTVRLPVHRLKWREHIKKNR
jgi:hypothetical protein